MTPPGRRGKRMIYRWPALIGAITLVGLVSGLLGDGAADAIAWAALVVPILVAATIIPAVRERFPG